MGDWSIASFSRATAGVAAGNLARFPEHAEFFDATVRALFTAGWVHPWANWRAEFVRAGREFAAPRLLLPEHVAHLATDVGWPKGEPGSDAEAQSVCLHLMTGDAIRSFARAGYLAFFGLPMVGVGEHRRAVEAITHVEVLVDSPALAVDCWRLGRQHSTKQRRANPFRQRAEQHTQKVTNKQNHPDSALSPLQLVLRHSADDATLHLGPHAGVHHGAAGRTAENLNPFDVQHSEVGMFAWRFAAQMRMLVDAIAPKLGWLDAPTWQAASASLRERSATMEQADAARLGKPPSRRPPWSSAPPGSP